MLAFLILMSYGIIIATWCMMIGIVSFMCGSDGLQEDIVHRRQHLTYSDILELCRHPVDLLPRSLCRNLITSVGELPLDIEHRALEHYASLVDKGDRVTDILDRRHIVGGVDDGMSLVTE